MARKKSEKVVFAFAGTAQAVYMGQCARKDNAPGRMIPLPREISAECGMAWCAPAEARGGLEQMAEKYGVEVEGVYELLL